MRAELIQETRFETKETPSEMSFLVYDARDFYPRGALQPGIGPPFPLSETPTDLTSFEQVCAILNRDRYTSGLLASLSQDINMYRKFGRKKLDKPYDLSNRLPPEKIDPQLTAEYLRETFFRKTRFNQLKAGEAFILIAHPQIPDLYIVDVIQGRYAAISHPIEDEDIEPELTIRPELPDYSQYFTDPRPYILELTDDRIKKAQDEGQRKHTGEAKHFFNLMHQADREVEEVLINLMDKVGPTLDGVRYFARAFSREVCRQAIAELRSGNWDSSATQKFIADCLTTTWFYNQIYQLDQRLYTERDERTKAHLIAKFKTSITTGPELVDMSVTSFRQAMEALFDAERIYSSVVAQTPWNRVGAEPFDCLQEVLWFRWEHNWDKWTDREKIAKSIRSDYFKEAAIRRKKIWAAEQGIYEVTIKDITKALHQQRKKWPSNKEMTAQMGRLSKYVNHEGMATDIAGVADKSRPSRLTRHLWATLKYASPGQWRVGNTILLSRLSRFESHPSEETVADPYWRDLGDERGRLVLSGESLSSPGSHLATEGKELFIEMRDRIIYQAERMGLELSDSRLNQITEECLNSDPDSKDDETIVRKFQHLVSEVDMEKLLPVILDLDEAEMLIVLHRLGYPVPADLIRSIKPLGNSTLEPNMHNISAVIKWFFEEKPDRYYQKLRSATHNLSVILK